MSRFEKLSSKAIEDELNVLIKELVEMDYPQEDKNMIFIRLIIEDAFSACKELLIDELKKGVNAAIEQAVTEALATSRSNHERE